jgi:metal-responsive CopG/Arc/MetJ family transcriptional regulator
MKTAISLPDKLFNDADEVAKRLRISRSELYATALAEYLTRQSATEITSRLNAVYQLVEGRPEPGLAGVQARGMARADHW